MNFDLDKYYTPIETISPILEDNFSRDNFNIIDTTCGSGNLLSAAENVFDKVQCVGIDQDKSTIMDLKKKNPQWKLSVADMLNPKSYSKSAAIKLKKESDLLLLNPPFSQGGRKSIPVHFDGECIKSSVAMAHILNSLNLFKPRNGAMIIAPESVLFSDTDAAARIALEKRFIISVVSELDCRTFTGATVRSTVLKLKPGRTIYPSEAVGNKQHVVYFDSIIRGGLPVHLIDNKKSRKAVPFIHSTDLNGITNSNIPTLLKTSILRKGRVSGHLILLPRVGIPTNKSISLLNLKSEVQLSDCVIAIKFRSQVSLKKAARIIRENHSDLVSMYRGTGARYITIDRLKSWLASYGIGYIE